MKRPPITNSISASRYVRDFANSFLNENSKKEKKNGENYYANLDTRLEKFNLIEFQQNIVDITNVHKKNRGRLLAQHSNTKSNSSLSLNFLRQKALNRTQYEYLVDKMEAIGALNNVVKNLKEEHEENRVSFILNKNIILGFENIFFKIILCNKFVLLENFKNSVLYHGIIAWLCPETMN